MTNDHATRPAEAGEGQDLLRLLAWASPAMPIGGFSYSHGLEYAVETGLVTGAPALRDYVRTALQQGGGRNDAILLTAAWRAGRGETPDRPLVGLLELAAALRGSAELSLESGAQGSALLRTLRAAWPHPALDRLRAEARALKLDPVHPVVFGFAAGAHRLALRLALLAYLHAFVAMIVSAGVRLIPLGQTDGQRLTAAAEPLIDDVARAAAAATLDDLGGAALMIDLCSMAHETEYTRLFRS